MSAPAAVPSPTRVMRSFCSWLSMSFPCAFGTNLQPGGEMRHAATARSAVNRIWLVGVRLLVEAALALLMRAPSPPVQPEG
jgi:hypothetical protein